MSSTYKKKLNATPFVITPDGYSNQEAAIVVGSEFSGKEFSELIQTWHREVDQCHCPIVGHLIPLKGKTIIATTIKTIASDSHSKRVGLRMTCGVILHNSLLISSSSVCIQAFKILEEYLETFSPNPFSIDGASKIVDYFQGQDKRIDEKVKESDINILLERFEDEFCLTDKPSVNMLDRFGYMATHYRQLKCQRVKPLRDRKGMMKFWHEVDNDLCQNQNNSSKIEITTENEKIMLQISVRNPD